MGLGLLRQVYNCQEDGLETDQPTLVGVDTIGQINADLSVGADVTSVKPLTANFGMSCNGMMLAGQGFKVSRTQAAKLIEQDGERVLQVIRPYVGGSGLLQQSKDWFVIDFFGLSEIEARSQFPASYQHLLATVKPERDLNRRPTLKRRWWVFGEPRKTFRPALSDLSRYIATTETAKHRVFQFVSSVVLPDHMVIAIASEEPYFLGVTSSIHHLQWVYSKCSLLGVATFEQGHRYNKSQIFDPFPFPDPTPDQRTAIAELAEELDATRKTVLAEVPDLTMTEIYNWRDKLRSKAELSPEHQARASAARAGIVDHLHSQLDAAVAAAYGWPADLPPAEIITRLVALNAERAEEERNGKVRWLRPDYQIPRFGKGKP